MMNPMRMNEWNEMNGLGAHSVFDVCSLLTAHVHLYVVSKRRRCQIIGEDEYSPHHSLTIAYYFLFFLCCLSSTPIFDTTKVICGIGYGCYGVCYIEALLCTISWLTAWIKVKYVCSLQSIFRGRISALSAECTNIQMYRCDASLRFALFVCQHIGREIVRARTTTITTAYVLYSYPKRARKSSLSQYHFNSSQRNKSISHSVFLDFLCTRLALFSFCWRFHLRECIFQLCI